MDVAPCPKCTPGAPAGVVGSCPVCLGPVGFDAHHGFTERHTPACPMGWLSIAHALSIASRQVLKWKV